MSEQKPAALADPIIERAPFAVITVDREGRVTAWNPAAERLFGWHEKEILGRPLPTIPPQRDAEFRHHFDRVLRGETVDGIETQRLRKDGGLVEVRVSAAPLYNGTTRVNGAVAFLSDVSQQKRAERSLQETEGRYQTLFERNPFPMWAYDLESLRFLAVNDAAVEHYGYSREEFLGMTIKDIRPPEEMRRLEEDVARITRGQVDPQSWNAAVWKHRKKDGTLFDVEILSTTLSFAGWHARLVLAKDISAERRLEEQLRQAQKMEALGQLAGGVAHDFNNLLGVVLGYADLLARELGPHDRRTERTRQIEKAIERAASLTRQLLAFSRKQILQPRVLDLNQVVEEVEKMLRRLIGEHIQLMTVYGTGLGRVKVDAGQLEQVIINLAVNARDAMPTGGKLIIETANVELDATYARLRPSARPGRYVLLTVSDTGHGMDTKTKSHIFEPFFTTKAQGEGTGLGLATVYGIVKQSGGHIEVYSEAGRGTAFKVYLPRTDEGVAQVAPEPSRAQPLTGSETVLVVEDEIELRMIICAVLEESGYTVLESENPEAALEIAQTHPEPIHLLITDLVMPRVSGRDVAAEIHRLRPNAKVLFMSGYTTEVVGHHGLLGADDHYLQKPFGAQALLERVREVLEES